MKAPNIIHENSNWIIINKPAGLDSQDSRDDRPSVVEWLQKRYGFSGLIHRLDFGTSGAMICAKNATAAQALTKKIQAQEIQRVYQALAIGTDLPPNGTFRSLQDGVEAITHYKVIETFLNSMHLELRLETGRKHQIRKHLFESNHPILGDHLYKKKGSDRLMKRPALHSFQLTIDGKTFEAPLPEDMNALIQKFRKSQADFNG